MQNAKDSFYIALRNRLAALNPARTIRVRGVQRPSLMVEDAEAPIGELANDVFVLRWTAVELVPTSPCVLIGLHCEIHYRTSGTEANAGLDRGRALSEMDRELMTVLQPAKTPKLSYSTTPAAPMQTSLFWTDPVLDPAEPQRNTLGRVAKVVVFAFEESGER